jgi:hypothetical protein
MDPIVYLGGVFGVMPEVNLPHILKPYQIMQFLFIAILGHLSGLN